MLSLIDWGIVLSSLLVLEVVDSGESIVAEGLAVVVHEQARAMTTNKINNTFVFISAF